MSADDTGARLFVGLQYLLPQHLLSGAVHWLARVQLSWVKNALIDNFVVNYRPDMSEAEESDPRKYASFNAFFTRALRPGARSVDPAPTALVSPVDGTVSQIGRIDGSSLVQAKGLTYTLESLLDEAAPAWAPVFRGGAFATLYLAPHDYHRIHMPLAGTLQAAWYVPGQLFSVNATTAAQVPGLFARNERVVCVFADGTLSFALVLVGALFVGSMSTVWHGDVTPRSPRVRGDLAVDFVRTGLKLGKGAEMGRFNMGSTVILLLPPGRSEWQDGLAAGSAIRMGQALARLS
ncbi:MAG TPA: archaetidylserine decarboxylase [Steroidobacteraceae bacterium]|nr:archaetidylserine decarboxylase [Steroidobacteraceae bacterium]